jgi:opacity protein-like surface antigen
VLAPGDAVGGATDPQPCGLNHNGTRLATARSRDTASHSSSCPRPLGTLWIDSAQPRWLATARGRLGYAVDKWLLYVTGGAAWAKIDSAEFLVTNLIPTATLQSDLCEPLIQSFRRRAALRGSSGRALLQS